MAGFDRLRGQFERRRRDQADWLSRNIAEVDIEEFTQDPAQGSSVVTSFELCGALPPTVTHMEKDVVVWATIGRAERQAAKELVERQRAADKLRIDELRHSAHGPRTGGMRLDSQDPGRPPQSLVHDTEISPQVSMESAAMENFSGEVLDPGTPGARNWESRITDFYRRWEARCQDEKEAEVKELQAEAHDQQMQKVREIHFTRNHEKATAAIRTAAKRFDVIYDNKEYKQNIRKEIARQDLERREQNATKNDAEHNRVKRAQVQKDSLNLANAFVAQRGSLEKTCKKIDLWKSRATDKAQAAERAELEKTQRAASSARAASQRALQEAQGRKVDGQLQRKQKYLVKIARDQVKKEATETREHVAAERDLERELICQRAELDAIRVDSRQGQHDIASYENTLTSLRELADKVRTHNADALDAWQAAPMSWKAPPKAVADQEQDPSATEAHALSDAEPRIRAALVGGLLGAASPLELFADFQPLDDYNPQQFDDIDHNHFTDMRNNLDSRNVDEATTPWPMACAPMRRDTNTPRTASRPWTSSRPGTTSTRRAPSPLYVTPLTDLRQQVGSHSARAPKKGDARPATMQSLAALRMIRRTGPVVRR